MRKARRRCVRSGGGACGYRTHLRRPIVSPSPACLLSYLLASLPTYLATYLPPYLPTCLLTRSSVDFSPTGDRLAVGCSSSQPCILDRDGRKLTTLMRGDMYIRDMRTTRGHVAGNPHPGPALALALTLALVLT